MKMLNELSKESAQSEVQVRRKKKLSIVMLSREMGR